MSAAKKTPPKLNGPQGNSTQRQGHLRTPVVAQPRKPLTVAVQAKQPPHAPPVYRPQPAPVTRQAKPPAPYQPGIKTGHARVAPPTYQPNQAHGALQAKLAGRQGQQIIHAYPSVIQRALRKWKFTEVRRLVSQNAPQNNEGRDIYIDRVVNLANDADDDTKNKIRGEAGRVYDLANPQPQQRKKKKNTEGPHPGWTVDISREVSKGYDRNSGGGAHRPKGMVWIDDNGDAWAEDKDEHAGAGYKKFTKVGTSWLYQGTYNMDLSFKNR